MRDSCTILTFSLRIHPTLLKKFRLIADYNGRSANRELEIMIREHIKDFEAEHGVINSEDLEKY